ncbi:MAG: CRISPR-associated endonuclease Cas2 [Bacillota bacterium]|nr:CRISPR-associated endonuclease Cas2 [Bacillota bacterium]
MAENKQWFLVAYDIRDPIRLRRTAKHLLGYGTRVQYSLFRCRLNKRQIERLRWELNRIMCDEDDLLIIGICGSCTSKIMTASNQDDWGETANYIIV